MAASSNSWIDCQFSRILAKEAVKNGKAKNAGVKNTAGNTNNAGSAALVNRRTSARVSNRYSPYGRSSRSLPAPVPEPPSADLLNLPQEALELVAIRNAPNTRHMRCLYCGMTIQSKTCSIECFRQFYQDHLAEIENDYVEIRPAGAMGYGAFLRPGVANIPAGTYLGIYAGEIQHKDSKEMDSTWYGYTLVDDIDARINADWTGNWTRFMNSHCRPNVEATTAQIGGILFVVFRTLRDIRPDEQLHIFYGPDYFKDMQCRCSHRRRPHQPAKVKGFKG
ncbi:hypothetical protein QBC47DRAFT_462807 [Echria macrotheca]|uniref:SET domain-containing protein n=1 Tax=Echria macrotheca TaxID=438768 RepID=A0AAJ0F9H1_9PEZI|nr:hypothetical protein QBC47DRAFT_462807 [Echria macrotheca]